MGLMNDFWAFKSLLLAAASVPSAAMVGIGMALGAAASWAGWQAGKPASPPMQPARA